MLSENARIDIALGSIAINNFPKMFEVWKMNGIWHEGLQMNI